MVAVESQVSCQLDAETVVLHFDKGVYFGLNEVGTLIWIRFSSLERCTKFVTRSWVTMKFPRAIRARIAHAAWRTLRKWLASNSRCDGNIEIARRSQESEGS